jgi:hypothetical protein
MLGVLDEVGQTAGVVQKLPHGDPVAVRQEVRQPLGDGGIEAQSPFADQLQHDGGDEGLGDAPDPVPGGGP